MRYASLGDVSTGTLRTEDLLETFASELEAHLSRQPKRFKRAKYREMIREAAKLVRTMQSDEPSFDYDPAELVCELQDALGDFAPPYAYFGTHEGDGASFGFYLSEDALREFDGLRVSDTSEVPRNYRGEVLEVNDHGNTTLYSAHPNARQTSRTGAWLRCIWAVV